MKKSGFPSTETIRNEMTQRDIAVICPPEISLQDYLTAVGTMLWELGFTPSERDIVFAAHHLGGVKKYIPCALIWVATLIDASTEKKRTADQLCVVFGGILAQEKFGWQRIVSTLESAHVEQSALSILPRQSDIQYVVAFAEVFAKIWQSNVR